MKQILIAIDQLINTLTGGYADESISARAYRKRHTQPFATLRAVIDGLFFWQKDHCESSYWSEVIRSQLPAEYRDKP